MGDWLRMGYGTGEAQAALAVSGVPRATGWQRGWLADYFWWQTIFGAIGCGLFFGGSCGWLRRRLPDATLLAKNKT